MYINGYYNFSLSFKARVLFALMKNMAKPQIIDSHCHLDFAAFTQDRNAILTNCVAAGITDIVVPGVLANTWNNLITWAEQSIDLPKVHYALGLHPIFLDRHKDEDLQTLDKLLNSNCAIAVGEIGLDFFVKTLDKTKQQYYFEQQLGLAKKYNLPVILHTRKSHDETLKQLKTQQVSGGIAHAFNGSKQQAHTYIDLGFKLGFGGMLTYTRSRKLRQLAHDLPLDSIVLETDSPDMTVEQHRGERNSPEYLPYVLTALAEIRSESIEQIAEQTSHNTKTVLALPN